MDTAVKQSNKENSKPEPGPKTTESKDVKSKVKPKRPATLRSKNEPREEKAGDKTESIKPSKPAASKDSDPTQRKTLSQAFRTDQTLRHRKLVLETQKPPSSVPPKPLLPGTYKGRVVKSKIDCFRKPPSGWEKNQSENKPKAEPKVRSKSTTALSASSRAGVQHSGSGSGAQVNAQKTVPQRRIHSSALARTATVSTKPPAVSTKPPAVSTKPPAVSTKPPAVSTKPPAVSTKPSAVSTKPPAVSTKPPAVSTKPPAVSTKPPAVSTKPPAVSTKPPAVSTKPPAVSTKPPAVSTKPSAVSTKPPAVSTKPPAVSTKPSAVSRKPVMMSARPPPVTSFIKKKEPLKPAAAASEKRPVSSSISQYRIRVESVDERRLKLAEWLTSKGKTLKRPAMTENSAPQTCEPRLGAEGEAQPEASERVEAAPVRETEQNKVPQRKPAFSSSPSHILNTTLDLLDNSDAEQPTEPEIRMESLVINLCERLEAMETPSSCRSQTKSAGNAEVKIEKETPEYEILEEEEQSEELKTTTGVEKAEEEEDGEEEHKMMKVKEKEEMELFEDEDEEEKMDSTPADVLDACVVKYSVKTTPFLRSVKKRMESEMAPGTPGSRRKSSIKELKFLTPVRRSSRIHRNLSRLPGMLNEHDPCVSSLAELELLDATDSNAYIYRKNPALLQHLIDQHPETQSSENTCK